MAAEREHLLRAYAADELDPKDGYPPVWHKTIKHLIRERAGNRCLRCQHPYVGGENGSGEWSPCDAECVHRLRDGDDRRETYPGSGEWEAHWRILTVHHLDGDKANCRWWNLAALCQRCHLEIQGRVRMSQVYPFEHSDWFKPFAAAYYAFVYLGADLTRQEVALRLDELLALERAA